jgi:hypothetical protein
MSTLDYCDAVTQSGKLCKRKATCDSSAHGSDGESYCKQHYTNYYDPSKGKFVVQKIARVARDKTTRLPMRYVQGLKTKEKQLYKKEIEETNKYYKSTGLVKGRADVRFALSKSPKNGIKRKDTPYPRAANMKRFSRNTSSLPKKRSSYSVEFEKRYGFKISELDKVKKLFPDTDVNMIIKKGEAAYASGSRPSVTGSGGAKQWGLARLASAMLSGRAMLIDKDLIGPKSLKVIFSKKYNK